MVHENSLANLKGSKLKKKGYGYRYSLPQEKIDELFTHLAEGVSLKQSAKKVNICFETARKYFKQGDVKRGIRPLQWRLTVFQDKVTEKYNVLLVERRSEMINIVRTSIEHMKKRMQEKPCKCCEETGTQTNRNGIKVQCPSCDGTGKTSGNMLDNSTLKDLERLIKLEVFLVGGVTQKEEEQKMLTAEEISNE